MAGDKQKTSSASAATVAKKKKKDKPSSSSSAKDKSKDKSKSKSSSSKSKRAATPPPPVSDALPASAAAAASSPSLAHNPDAVQLFRRYDRARAGVLTRLDFLQLLKDYANPPALDGTAAADSSLQNADALRAGRAMLQRARNPLSLTDASGVPLGYERSDKNSEFEAGQLFERYDKDRTGALTLDKFRGFFTDFEPQLTAFVEDLNYFTIPHPNSAPAPVSSEPQTPASAPKAQDSSLASPPRENMPSTPGADVRDDAERRTALKSSYHTALWKLRKLCKDELSEQRECILETMTSVRVSIAEKQSARQEMMPPVRWRQSGAFDDRKPGNRSKESLVSRWPGHDDAENQAVELYEAMEEDLERIDEIGAFVQRYLKKGAGVSLKDIEDFLSRASELQEQAQYLAMKDYAVPRSMASNLSTNDSSNRPRQHPAILSPSQSATRKAEVKRLSAAQTTASPESSGGDARHNAELRQLLRVKDQMIYQLLLERTEMRKQKASMESYLQELSEVSTAEMKKWSRLTDEMQIEIEHLRAQVHHQQSSR